MKIKVIELLNKIANDEELPKKIKYRNKIYIKRSDCYWYILENGTFDDELFVRIDCLNDEVEIIEEPKKIEKIDFGTLNTQKGKNRAMKDAINKLIDAVNELKRDK